MNTLIGLVVLLLAIISIIAYGIRLYNRLVFLKFNTEKSFANIDVILKQRADEIPNIINVVKKHTSYEKNTLDKLTKLRTKYFDENNADKKVKLNNEISNLFGEILMISEAYPELKSIDAFLRLQTRVSELEGIIADRREFFNESINMYNIGINEFPNFILAKLLNYKNKSLLTITDTEKRYDGVTF